MDSRLRSLIVVCQLLALGILAPDSGQAADGTGNVHVPNRLDDPTVHSVTLTGLDGSGYLRGDVADVTNAVPHLAPRAYSATHEFLFDPDVLWAERIHFSETMAYYHSKSFHDYLGDLGFSGVAAPLGVVVFAGEWYGGTWDPAASAYHPDTGTITLSSDLFPMDSEAMDGDMIVHEFCHAMQHAVRPSTADLFQGSTIVTPTDQARALLEGQADFAASSFFDDPEHAEYAAAEVWRHGAFRRNLENFYSLENLPFSSGAYTIGMIFSGAMWDLRATVGAEAADTLAMRMIQTVVDNDPQTPELNATLSDALDAIRQADANLYGGMHDDEIRQAFGVHGIGTYDFSTAFPMVRDPGNDYEGLQARTVAGASVVAVTFDEFVTKLDDAWFTTDQYPEPGVDEKATIDYLELLDGTGAVVGTYTGRELQGATIVVLGDTVQFHLVTDSYRAPFGYRVLDIKSVLPGDASLDDCVDGLDYVIWSNNYDPFAGEKIWQQGDHSGDGIVDGLDYVVWSNHYKEGCPPGVVPEPATLSLLAMGAAGLVLYGKRRPRGAPGKELVPRRH